MPALLAGQALISLISVLFIRVLRVPRPDFRLHVFGAVYALFIYLHLGALLASGFSNDESEEGASKYAVHIWVFAVSLLIYGAITPWADVASLPTADEPHYLLLTHSLVFDHDFDLANNYARGDYKRFYPPLIPRSDHHTVVNERNQEVPVHDVGISILLVPGYALAGRLGAMLELNAFGAILVLGIFVLGMKLGAPRRAALASWALFAFTSPIVVYSSQIYPELAGAALTVWAAVAYLVYLNKGRWRHLLFAASALAVLPWFSIRYWVILGPVLAVIAFRLIASSGSSKPGVLKGLGLTIAPLVISLVAFALFDWYWYQTPIPNAGYVLLLRPRPSLLTPYLVPGLPGLLFDRAFGLLTTAPVYLLVIAGAWVLCRRKTWQLALVGLPALAYILLAALNRFWYGGWAPPPRYIVTGVAILAPLSALVFSHRTPRVLVAVLAAWSLFIALSYTAFPLARYTYWNVNSGALSDFLASRLGFHFGVVFPSFIRARAWDYLLALSWTALASAGVYLLVSRAAADEPEPAAFSGTRDYPRAAALP
jgi:hypothetical protein